MKTHEPRITIAAMEKVVLPKMNLATTLPPAVGSKSVVGSSDEVARADHTHEGLHDVNGITGSVTLAAGSNITIDTNPATKTITISAVGGGGGSGAGAASSLFIDSKYIHLVTPVVTGQRGIVLVPENIILKDWRVLSVGDNPQPLTTSFSLKRTTLSQYPSGWQDLIGNPALKPRLDSAVQNSGTAEGWAEAGLPADTLLSLEVDNNAVGTVYLVLRYAHGFVVRAADNLALSDAVEIYTVEMQSVADGLTLSDAAELTLQEPPSSTITINASDSISLADTAVLTLQATGTLTIGAADGISLADTAALTLLDAVITINAVDAISLADNVATTLTSPTTYLPPDDAWSEDYLGIFVDDKTALSPLWDGNTSTYYTIYASASEGIPYAVIFRWLNTISGVSQLGVYRQVPVGMLVTLYNGATQVGSYTIPYGGGWFYISVSGLSFNKIVFRPAALTGQALQIHEVQFVVT